MRDGVSLKTALLLTLAPLGCGGNATPSDEAVSAYLDRSGLNHDAAMSPSPGTPAPIAKRLAITVESGTALPDLDAGPGESDPYVILEIEGQRQRSSVVEGNLEPIWGDTFVFDIGPSGVLVVTLMDEDSLSSDEAFGTMSQPLPTLMVGESTTMDIPFGQGERGTVRLTLTGMARP